MPAIPALAASSSIVSSATSGLALGLILVVFAILSVIGVFVIIVVANRADPDPSGRRPLVVYYFAVSFFAVFSVLFATFAIAISLSSLIGTHAAASGGSIHPVGDAVARSVVLAGLVAAIGTILLVTHIPRGLGLSGGADGRRGPPGRVAQSYAAAVAFVGVVIASISAVALVYEVVRILGPGVFLLSGSRVDGLRTVVPAGYLMLASILLAVVHIRLLPPDVRGFVPFGRGGNRIPPGAPGPMVGPPPAGPPTTSAPMAGTPLGGVPVSPLQTVVGGGFAGSGSGVHGVGPERPGPEAVAPPPAWPPTGYTTEQYQRPI